MMLPPTAPTTISMSATESASRIEIRADASASPIHSADASHILSIIDHAALSVSSPRHELATEKARFMVARPMKYRLARPADSYRCSVAVGVISHCGRFRGTPSPSPRTLAAADRGVNGKPDFARAAVPLECAPPSGQDACS